MQQVNGDLLLISGDSGISTLSSSTAQIVVQFWKRFFNVGGMKPTMSMDNSYEIL